MLKLDYHASRVLGATNLVMKLREVSGRGSSAFRAMAKETLQAAENDLHLEMQAYLDLRAEAEKQFEGMESTLVSVLDERN